MQNQTYDIIVIGGGHAGCEAALASARIGLKTLLLTMNLQTIAQMSCNPAVGGLAKGQLVKEIDALGGEMAKITDRSTLQFRMLNRSKGPAVWSPRAQCDRNLYAREMRKVLESEPNLDLRQNMVVDFDTRGGRITEVICQTGQRIECRAAVLCAGTFLNGLIHVGEFQIPAGRIGEPSALFLTQNLEKQNFISGRLKTGTPPRLDGRTIDYTQCEDQPGDGRIIPFSKSHKVHYSKQLNCYLTWTNDKTHQIIRDGLTQSPLFAGRITGRGPRYCPSIEDKVVRFAEKERHQIFLEPEGWDTFEFYMNGFSSSLPESIQYQALTTIKGLEKVEMMRAGYAVEYDFFPAYQLHYSLETKNIEGLFFAGQINGTTGYEEAAAQGLIAGINAAQKIKGEEPLILRRDQAYIGVLIDDLITKTPDEPYRMFTSRAEHRLILRQDNADLRLTEIGRELGLVRDEQHNAYLIKKQLLSEVEGFLNEAKLEQLTDSGLLADPNLKGHRFASILKRPEATLENLLQTAPELSPIRRLLEDEEMMAAIEMDIKYAGYIKRELLRSDQLKSLENMKIPKDLEYQEIVSVSLEAREKLNKFRPQTLGQAGRISGVKPTDCSALLIHLKKLAKI